MNQDKTDVTDFLADESFINYCRNSSPQDVAYWENYISQNPQLTATIALAREQFFLLFNELADYDRQEQAMLLKNKLNQNEMAPVIRLENRGERNPKRNSSAWLKLAGIAAVIIPVIFLSVQYFIHSGRDKIRTYTTTLGERKNIQLPDGSVVNLNAGSEITIHNDFGVTSRDVYLKGEAFFDVKHDKKSPFIVHTEVMDIKALGTAFDVKAYQNEKVTATTLIRGLIAVTLKEQDNLVLLLHPHQKIEWQHKTPATAGSNPLKKTEQVAIPEEETPKTIKVTNQGDIKEIAWKENKLVFEDDSLEDIAKLLARWYDVGIEFEDEEVGNYHFTGVFEKEDLQTVLSIMQESKPFHFKINNGETMTILLSK